jgi:hypothetical protein
VLQDNMVSSGIERTNSDAAALSFCGLGEGRYGGGLNTNLRFGGVEQVADQGFHAAINRPSEVHRDAHVLDSLVEGRTLLGGDRNKSFPLRMLPYYAAVRCRIHALWVGLKASHLILAHSEFSIDQSCGSCAGTGCWIPSPAIVSV